jgi:hypothetical protein
MAQIAQRCPVFIAHASGEIRIVQPLISRGLRHILQHAQPLLNRVPAVRRQLLPSRQHIVSHVSTLLWRHAIPYPRAIAHILLLARAKPVKSLFVLNHSSLILLAQIVKVL